MGGSRSNASTCPSFRRDSLETSAKARGDRPLRRALRQRLGHMRRALAGMPANTLHLNTWGQYGGLSSQYYYQGRFELEDHEALVIETTNFADRFAFQGSSENMRLTERFTRTGEDTMQYAFSVEDSDTWTSPWAGEMEIRRTEGPIRPVITVDFCRDAGSKPIRVPCRRFACSSASCANTCRARRRALMRSNEACSCAFAAAVRNSGASGELARRVLLAVAGG